MPTGEMRQMQQPEPTAAVPAVNLTLAARKLDAIYGDHIHVYNGSLLNGGIPMDWMWQAYWQQMTQIPPIHYSVPKGVVGRHFLTILTHKFQAMQVAQTSNLEKPLVFAAIILPKTPGVRAAKDICLCMQQ